MAHVAPTQPHLPILTFSHSIKEEKPVHIVSKWMKKISHPKRKRIKNDHNMLLFIFALQESTTNQTPQNLPLTFEHEESLINMMKLLSS
jgi:hypothetical protein